MRNTVALLLAGCTAVSLAACSSNTAATASADTCEIVMITDGAEGNVQDNGYNESVYNGMSEYAAANDKTYEYLIPESESTEAYLTSINQAVSDGAKVIICPGSGFEEAIYQAQSDHPDVAFLLFDGTPHDADYNYTIKDNVHCVIFQEEQSGYLAGYAAVKEGYTSLGFIGGESVPSVIRYGYGFIQGADAAAAEMNVNVSVNYSYANSFQPSDEIQSAADGWYKNATQVIFACGGLLYESVFQAAEDNNGKTIGVDTDQSKLSDTVITSAVKNLGPVTEECLQDFYGNDGVWPTKDAGTLTALGANDNAIGLPTASWSFTTFTVEEYDALYAELKSGELTVSNAVDEQPAVSEHTTVTFE